MFANKYSGLKAAIYCCLMLAAVATHAQQASPAALSAPPVAAPAVTLRTSEAANTIAEINERMSVMQAQLAQLELQAKIAAKNDEIRRYNKAPEVMDDGFTPAVVEIGGVDGKLTANLLVQGGNIQTVRVGDKVGAWDIKAISIDSLTMSRGKDLKRLSFGSYVQTPQQGPGALGTPGMIPGMPLPR